MFIANLRKGVSFALFLFFFFGCTKPCQQWVLTSIQTHHCCCDAAKACWFTENSFQGIDVEIVCSANETQVYFDIYTFEFPFIENNPLKTEIVIHAEEQEYHFIVDRFEGGQRLQLSAEAGSKVLELLSAGVSFTICIENYSETVLPLNFGCVFQKARKFGVNQRSRRTLSKRRENFDIQ